MNFPQILLSGAFHSTAALLLAGLMTSRLSAPQHKHQVRLVAFLMLLALPLCWLLVPALGWDAIVHLLQVEEFAAPGAASGGAVARDLPAFSFLAGADAQVPVAESVPLGLVVAYAWAVVSLVLLACILRSHRSAKRLAARSFDSPWTAGTIPVRLSDEVTAPAVAGILRPIILLPRSALRWTPSQVEAALAHEAAHIGRRDVVSALAADVACSLYWFNPLAWRARAALSLEREMACDAQVLAGGMTPFDYADALLAAARSVRGPPPKGALAMATVPEVESRVRFILEAGAEAKGRCRFKALPVALLAVSVPFLAALRPAEPTAGTSLKGTPGAVADRPAETALVNPRSELIPLDYMAMARAAANIPVSGPDAEGIAKLKAYLNRRPEGFDDLVRERAIWTLSRIRAGSLLEPLLEDLGNRDWRVRAYATWGLAVVRSPRATPHLIPLLNDPVWRVRAGAAAAIEELEDRSARSAMAAALSDPIWQVRYSAVEYFSDDPDPAERARLRALRTDAHTGTRLLVQEALNNRH